MIVTIDQLPYHYQNLNLTELNCDALIEHQYLPTLPVIISEFGKIAVLLLCLGFLLTLMNICIFIEECIFLFRRWPLRSYCTTIGILAVFPISSICFFLTLLMPRAHDVNTTTATLYQPLSLVLFYKLVVSYMGREKNLKDSLMNHNVPTKSPPLYWFCICLPNTSMNKNLYYLMKACIYQLFMAPCFLYFVMGVCSKTGVYMAGQFSLENAAIYIVALGALSFCVGIYCLEIFFKMARQVLPGFHIGSKYYILQSYFVITRFHVLIFDALGNNGFLPCLPPISGYVNGLYVRTFLLLVFSFLLSLLARHIFAKPAPNHRSLEIYNDSIDWHSYSRDGQQQGQQSHTATPTIAQLDYNTNTVWHQSIDGATSITNQPYLNYNQNNSSSSNGIVVGKCVITNPSIVTVNSRTKTPTTNQNEPTTKINILCNSLTTLDYVDGDTDNNNNNNHSRTAISGYSNGNAGHSRLSPEIATALFNQKNISSTISSLSSPTLLYNNYNCQTTSLENMPTDGIVNCANHKSQSIISFTSSKFNSNEFFQTMHGSNDSTSVKSLEVLGSI